MNLPKITNKQEEIIHLVYTYRYVNRIQIQAFMNHKDKKTINMWLKDLTEKQYVNRIYSDHFLEKTKPAIYYMGLNGIRHLKTASQYPIEELRKRYRESDRSQGFIDRSILVAQCCLDMQAKNSPILAYHSYTQAQYLDPVHAFHFLAEDETLRPDMCIVKDAFTDCKKQKSNQSPPMRTNYLVEIFDHTLPRYMLRKRIKDYTDYLIEHDWNSDAHNPLPVVLLVVPSLADLICAKRKVNNLLLDEYYEPAAIPAHIHLRFTTTEQLRQRGITALIWEERRTLHAI